MASSDVGSDPDLTGLRILVVGFNYSPRHTGVAPYTWQACEDMQRRGATVHVIAGMPHFPYGPFASARARLSVDEIGREGVTVNRLRVPVPALTSRIKRGGYEATFGAHVLTRRLAGRPDVVVAVVPTLLGAVSAAFVARRTGARLAVWVQEFMGPAAARIGPVSRGPGARATAHIEACLLRQADVVLVLNDDVRRYAENSGVLAERIVLRPEWTNLQLRQAAGADAVVTRVNTVLPPGARTAREGKVPSKRLRSRATDSRPAPAANCQPAERALALAEIASAITGR